VRAFALILVLSACSDDGPGDIHAFADCDAAWVRNGWTECERACVSSTIALNAMGTACTARTSVGMASCSKTFVFEGVTGCCISNSPQMLFGECDP
jgi:hypothetical protein